MEFFANHLCIFYMYGEVGNDKCTDMQLIFQDLPNPSVFITTPTVGRTGVNLIPCDAVIKQQVWVLNEQCQTFARVVWLGQNRVQHVLQLNTDLSDYNIRPSDFHQIPGVSQMRVLYGRISPPNIMFSVMYQILGWPEYHKK